MVARPGCRLCLLDQLGDGSAAHGLSADQAGHGVGASAFEDPHLIPADHTLLAPGMMLAVEPGAYLRGRYGVRIEDVFIVGRD